MITGVFVWTFHGVLEAIALGFVLLILMLAGVIKMIERWDKWRDSRKKQGDLK